MPVDLHNNSSYLYHPIMPKREQSRRFDVDHGYWPCDPGHGHWLCLEVCAHDEGHQAEPTAIARHGYWWVSRRMGVSWQPRPEAGTRWRPTLRKLKRRR